MILSASLLKASIMYGIPEIFAASSVRARSFLKRNKGIIKD